MVARINCIIIEDELPASILLEMHIAKFDSLQLQGKFGSISKAMATLKEKKIDLIFLDINLPGKSGIEFAASLPQGISVIFTTAYASYAVAGFEMDAVDYILKPISFERFSRSVNKFLKLHYAGIAVAATPVQQLEKPFVFVKTERKMIKFYLDEIAYFESQGNYLLIYTLTDCFKVHQSLSEMEDKIPENLFCRVHRSFLVAIDKINSFNTNFVWVANTEIPIGRLYSKGVVEVLRGLRKQRE